MGINNLLLILLIFSISSRVDSRVAECCAGSVTYKLAFKGTWSRKSHPFNFPSKLARFSHFIGCSHSDEYVLWRAGKYSTPAIETMSTNSNITLLMSKMKQAKDQNQIECIFSTKRLKDGSSIEETYVTVNSIHPFLSGISSIVPSPDWFVVMDAIDMCNRETCKWKSNEVIQLVAFDAGVDGGATFISKHLKENPPLPVKTLNKGHKKYNLPFGTLSISIETNKMGCQAIMERPITVCPFSNWSAWKLSADGVSEWRAMVSDCGSQKYVQKRTCIRRCSFRTRKRT